MENQPDSLVDSHSYIAHQRFCIHHDIFRFSEMIHFTDFKWEFPCFNHRIRSIIGLNTEIRRNCHVISEIK